MILSYLQIEEIAAAVIKDFNRFFYGEMSAEESRRLHATPIDQFASDYLGLSVSFAHLSNDGSLCGLTAYSDTECEINDYGVKRLIPLKQNQVIMDDSFIQSYQMKKLCGKRRFTLAHECAHQILYHIQPNEVKSACRRRYADGLTYSARDLKTREDWNEWQANALGAAILLPQKEIDLAMWYFTCGEKLKIYKDFIPIRERSTIKMICSMYGVSMTAAVIRLKQLGYIEELPSLETADPLEA